MNNVATPNPNVWKRLTNIPVTHCSNQNCGFSWKCRSFLLEYWKIDGAKEVFTYIIEHGCIVSIPQFWIINGHRGGRKTPLPSQIGTFKLNAQYIINEGWKEEIGFLSSSGLLVILDRNLGVLTTTWIPMGKNRQLLKHDDLLDPIQSWTQNN